VEFGHRATVPTIGYRNDGGNTVLEDMRITAARGIDITDPSASNTTARRVDITAPQGILAQQEDLWLGSSVLRTEATSAHAGGSYGLLADQGDRINESVVSNVTLLGDAQFGIRVIARPSGSIQRRAFSGDSIYLGPGFTTKGFWFDREPIGTTPPSLDAQIANTGVPDSYIVGGVETWYQAVDDVGVSLGPRYLVPPAHLLTGDLRPGAGSPLIDGGAGAVPAWMEPFDLLGAARAVDGDGDGSAVRDIGALEYQPPAPVVGGPTGAPAAGTGRQAASSDAPPPPAAAPQGGSQPSQVIVEPPRPRVAFGSLGKLRVRRGRIAVPVQCAPACKLRLVLRTSGRRGRTLGSVSETRARSGRRTLSVKLSKAGARVLRARRRTSVVLTVTTPGAATVKRSAVLRRR
jgi:hypothetical protein